MLTASRWKQVQDLGFELLAVREPEQQVQTGLHALHRLLPGGVAADVHVEPRGPVRVAETPALLLPAMDRHSPEVLLSSPVIPWLRAHGNLQGLRVEDLCTPRQWDANPMRRELLEPHGVPYAALSAQITIQPDGGESMHCWGVNRDLPFSDAEVELLQAFTPFLRRAADDRQQTGLVLDLDQAVAAGAGLLIFHGKTVAYCNSEAAGLMELHRVTADTIARHSCAGLSASSPAGTLRSPRGGLRLRWRPALPGSSAVVMSDVPLDLPGRERLTPRQHAILDHLSRGSTAAAIAHRLGISDRTVHKHLQNLYRSLGVTDRLNAVLVGHDLGLLPLLRNAGR